MHDDFASTFTIWATAHRVALDMNGSRVRAAQDMMIRWEKMFRKFLNPLPTAEELSDATDWMLQTEELAMKPWRVHYAVIKRRILFRREEAAKLAEHEKRRQEEAQAVADRAANPEKFKKLDAQLKAVIGKIGESA